MLRTRGPGGQEWPGKGLAVSLALLAAVLVAGCSADESATTVQAATTTSIDATATTTQPESDLAEDIDRYLGSLADSDAFTGAVLLADSNGLVLGEGYGLADRELGVPNTPRTRFLIYSITKQFTAMGILILQDRGDLDVDDPVCD